MLKRTRIVFGTGLLIGLLVAVGIALWWGQGPSESHVRKTVITTVQKEAPASFLVTGTIHISTTVAIDSSDYVTPDWLTHVLGQTQPTVLSLLKGGSRTEVRVPGRISYGFDVRSLTAEMISVERGGVIAVDLPELSVHSVEPELSQLQVRSSTDGWMRVFPSSVREDVRKRALAGVEEAFRTQAQARLRSATQPRVNTARALEKMLTPALKAAGIEDPRFRMQLGDRLSLSPRPEEGQNFQK